MANMFVRSIKMYIYLGNILVHEFDTYFGITLSEEHAKLMTETHQNNADTDKLKKREWHMFDLPRMLVCGSKAFADELISILKQYEIKGTLQVSWLKEGEEND